MFKLCTLSQLFTSNISYANKKLDINLIRLIHSTLLCNIKTRIKVNEYLLNRSIPASEILRNLTENDAKELENLKLDYQFQLTKGSLVPKSICDSDYLELLCLSYNQKRKYLRFLAKKEFSKENDEIKKAEKKVYMENVKAEVSYCYCSMTTDKPDTPLSAAAD